MIYATELYRVQVINNNGAPEVDDGDTIEALQGNNG